MKKLTVLVAALALAVVPVFAQDAPKEKKIDVTGKWDSTVESPQGTIASVATYKQEGESLTGTHVGQMGEVALKGTVKGNQITYTITIDMQGQQLTITYSGKIDGDAIAGTAEFGGMGEAAWTAKRKK
jgi:D-glucosaminate-6-phosphate ammonia-lyase